MVTPEFESHPSHFSFLDGPPPPNIKGGMGVCLGGLTPTSPNGVELALSKVRSTEREIDVIIRAPNEVARLKALDSLPSSKTSVLFLDSLPKVYNGFFMIKMNGKFTNFLKRK